MINGTGEARFAPSPPTLSANPRPPGLWLWRGTRTPTRDLLTLAVSLARTQSLRIFDGCNGFDGYLVARLACRLDPDPSALLRRITLSRAFTCFQLARLIATAPLTPEPLFLLGLLDTFYDENVPLPEAERLLEETLHPLRRLGEHAPILIATGDPRGLDEKRGVLLNRLQAASNPVPLPIALPEPPAPMQLPFSLWESPASGGLCTGPGGEGHV